MSGHSKWANIKHKKGAVDAKRGKVFTKIVRVINSAVRKGGPDAGSNPTLRLALEKARAANMPKDNIEKAIKKAAGTGDNKQDEELLYEGYAQGGVALLVEALTDNKNRTTPEMRKIFEKGGGNLGEIGCVGWMFNKVGMISIENCEKSEDEMMEIALEHGADDLQMDGATAMMRTTFDDFAKVMDRIRSQGFEVKGEIRYIADNNIPVDVEVARKVLNLMESIEDHDDVQNVYCNMEIPLDVQALLDAED